MTRSVSSRLLSKCEKLINFFKSNGIKLTHFEELLGDPFVVHLNFRDHITGNVTGTAGNFTPIKSIGIFIASHLIFCGEEEINFPSNKTFK
jgi:hypothetical protein